MLVVLEKAKPSKDPRFGYGIERTRTLKSISLSGAKVRHDSGGRLIVIELTVESRKKLKKLLPGIQILSVNSEVKDLISKLDPTEKLFLRALKIRNSKSYRNSKKRRKYGESPEEKELFSASCVREV